MKRNRVQLACAATAVTVALPFAALVAGTSSAGAAGAAPGPQSTAAAAFTAAGAGPSAPVARAAVAATTPAKSSSTNAWTTPVAVGDAPTAAQNGIVTRIGLTSNGKGTIAWNAGGDSTPAIVTRDFTVSGVLTTGIAIGPGSLVSSVTRDATGNVAISGQSAGSPASAWVATRAADPSTAWTGLRPVASGVNVAAPAVFGLKKGFLVAQTTSFIPTSSADGLPSAAAFGIPIDGSSIPLGKPITGVETGDFSHGADGSNWALTSTGHAVTTGRRETSTASKGKAPKSVAAVVRIGTSPTRNSILGVDRFGGGAITTVGKEIAIAGLDVQQTNEIAVRGVPVVAQGEEGKIGEAVPIDGVPDRRALEVDVAGKIGGGAVVTWLQQTSSKAENLLGQPKWAIVDADGNVEERGAFTTATDARDLRVVRVGTAAVAVWIRGTGTAAKWYAAKISDDSVRLIKAPTGTPVGRLEGNLNTSQLTSNGNQVALSFVDAATHTVRVAVQTLK
ncbi:MAG: hypothetical protein AAGC46_17940 [Solirubrobacteraceae bacterium]